MAPRDGQQRSRRGKRRPPSSSSPSPSSLILLVALLALLLLLPLGADAYLAPSFSRLHHARSRRAPCMSSGGVDRQGLLRTTLSLSTAAGAAAMGLLRPAGPARAADDDEDARPASKLYDRFFQDNIKNPGIATFGSPTMVFLPPWMLGEWDCTMVFDTYKFPLGDDFVPPQILRSVKAVDQGTPTSFRLRFYSTLPDTAENTLRVSLGSMPKSEVVPDRVFNTRSVLDAYYGYSAVSQIDYEPSKNPLRMKIEFATIGRDLQPLPQRRQELFFNNIAFESPTPDLYVCSEFVRTVTLGPRSVTVSDSETLSAYTLQPDGRTVKGRQRVAVYLTPNPNSKEGAMYFETGGKAVALFDYSFEMRKQGDCVVSPKGVEQCVDASGGASYRDLRGGDGEEDEE